jgi:hypothetical protein
VKANEAACGAQLQNALAVEGDAPEIFTDALSQIPWALDQPVTRDVGRVIEVAVVEIRNYSRL